MPSLSQSRYRLAAPWNAYGDPGSGTCSLTQANGRWLPSFATCSSAGMSWDGPITSRRTPTRVRSYRIPRNGRISATRLSFLQSCGSGTTDRRVPKSRRVSVADDHDLELLFRNAHRTVSTIPLYRALGGADRPTSTRSGLTARSTLTGIAPGHQADRNGMVVPVELSVVAPLTSSAVSETARGTSRLSPSSRRWDGRRWANENRLLWM
jgi:hypothetical protein